MRLKHLRNPADTLLLSSLNQRVQQMELTRDFYFYSVLWTKLIVYTSLTGLFYCALYYIEMPFVFVLAYIGYGLSLLFFAFNFSHDFSHDTIFKSKKANLLGFKILYTWVGAHPSSWKERHVNSHHYAPNVKEYDTDLQITSLIRVSPESGWKRHHRFQHLYAPIAYMTYSLYWIFIKDLIVLAKPEKDQRRSVCYIGEFIFQKIIYITVTLILPLMYSQIGDVWVWIAFFVMHALQSLVLLFTFFMTHHVEKTAYPETDESGIIQTSWLMNQIICSNDMHPFSRSANFILGGFNNHIAHHLFPHIHHIYYPKLSRLLYDTLREHGIFPNQTSYWGGIVSHLRFLKRMGETAS